MSEVWRDVVGYEGRYQVSNYGNVKSIIFSKNGKEFSLSLLNGKDYLLVKLYKDGKGSMQRVHRLVAEAFIDNPDNLPVVNHKNWDKHDNRAENLEWCSYSYNNSYLPPESKKAKAKKLRANCQDSSGKQFASPKRVICIETGKMFNSISEAARFTGVEQSNISRALAGRQRTSSGYHWKYADEESKIIGTLSLARGQITDWIPACETNTGVFATEVFDLSDLRKMKGRIKFLVRANNGKTEICLCSSDYDPDGT